MNNSDDFLSRWSRRKQQAAREAASSKDKGDVAKIGETTRASPAADEPASATSAEEPLFDLSKLPSLDSIGPDSDVSLFMQPGVPASLSRAALRRAWSADPAIRDFIGLSENAWDFTKPETITGFGPLLPIDDVKKLLANIISDDDKTGEKVVATASQQPDTEGDSQALTSQAADVDGNSVAVETPVPEQSGDELRCTKIDLATQYEKHSNEPATPASGRRHGGALPT